MDAGRSCRLPEDHRGYFSFDIHLHRFTVRLQTDDRRILEAVQGSIDPRLSRAGTRSPVSAPGRGGCGGPLQGHRGKEHELELCLMRRPSDLSLAAPPPAEAAAAFEELALHVSHGERRLWIDGGSMVAIDARRGSAMGYVAAKHLDSPWIIAHRIFFLSVVELFRCRRTYYIHAGCVSSGRRGILVCGGSGRGKSTITYALARGGFSFISDDGVFIRKGRAGIEVFTFPERIKLDARSCAFFPELSAHGAAKGKSEIPLEATGIQRTSACAKPSLLLFPVGSRRAKSRLEPLAACEAAARLLGQSIALAAASEFHGQLEILTALAAGVPCYELRAARDFDDMPRLVADALGGALPSTLKSGRPVVSKAAGERR